MTSSEIDSLEDRARCHLQRAAFYERRARRLRIAAAFFALVAIFCSVVLLLRWR